MVAEGDDVLVGDPETGTIPAIGGVVITALQRGAPIADASALDGQFWYGLLCATLLLGPYLLAATFAVKEHAQRILTHGAE